GGSRQLCARDRVAMLMDPGTFSELEPFRRARAAQYGSTAPADGDGVIVGWGLVRGRQTAFVAHDFAFAGGSIGASFAAKVTRIQRLASGRRMPTVYFNDSGRARL